MPEKIRVLFISTQPFFQWRGSSIRVKFNLLALESLGYEVDLLTLPIGEDDAEVRSRVYRVWSLPGVSNIPIGPSAPKLVFDLFLLVRAFMLGINRRYQVVHATEEGGMIAWLVARLTGARCIYEKHSDPAAYRKGGLRNMVMAMYRSTEVFTTRRSDSVICTGPGLAEQARKYSPDADIHHIPDIPSSLHEPDDVEIRRARQKLTVHDGEVVVTYVGSFAVYQGIELLFETMPIVLSSTDKVRFVIIGGEKPEIEEFRARLGSFVPRVCFLGRIDPNNLPAYLKASDIVLAPRRAGINTPLKILDYFKAGTAIVATDTQANRLILDGDCAHLCEFDANAFAIAIRELANNPEERSRLAENGRRLYETRFNFEVFQQKLAAVYDPLLGQ